MNKTENINRCDVLSRCVSIDLEVDPEKAKIFALAAVAQDSDAPKIVAKNNIGMALTELDAFCQGFDHVIGHNIPTYPIWSQRRRGSWPWRKHR